MNVVILNRDDVLRLDTMLRQRVQEPAAEALQRATVGTFEYAAANLTMLQCETLRRALLDAVKRARD